MLYFFQQLIVVFNAVAPFFLVMGVGWFVRRIGLVGDPFFGGLNKLAFFCFFPALLFMNMYRADLAAAFDPALVGYFVAGLGTIYLILWVIAARSLSDRQRVAAFVQAAYRSNYTVLAIAIVTSLMGPESLPQTALMMPVVIGFQTILAATLFVVTGLDTKVSSGERMKSVLVGILKMPMVVVAIVGLLFNFSGLGLPLVVDRSLSNVAAMAAPAGLIAIGGALSMEKVRRHLRFAIATTAVKNLVVPLVFIAPAILLGFRGVELAILAMVGLSPVASISYVTAVEMGGPEAGDLTAGCLVLSNAVGVFTIIPGLAILRALGLF